MKKLLKFLINLFFLNTIKGFLEPNNISETISFQNIDKWLKDTLIKLPHHIQIKISSNRINENLDNQYVRWFLEQSKYPLTVSILYEQNEFMVPNKGYRSGQDVYVILCDVNKLETFDKSEFQSAGVYFFIIVNQEIMHKLSDIFQYMWKNLFVYQIYLLSEDGVFIYHPFAMKSNGDYGRIIKYIGDIALKEFLFKNMHGYPLRVQMFTSTYSIPVKDGKSNRVIAFKGVDGKVASLLQEQLNFTMILQDPDQNLFGSRLSNGSFNGALGLAINNQLDICLTAFFIKDYLTNKISLSVAVYDDKLCIYTKKAQRIPNSMMPLFSLNYNVWIFFVLTLLLCSIVCRWEKSFSGQYVEILVNTSLAWVRYTLLKYPPFHNERILVVSICLVSVIFGTILECSLSAVFIYPLYFKDINTLQELDDSNFKIFYRHQSMANDLFVSDTSELLNSLNKKLIYKNSSLLINEIMDKNNVAGVSRYKNLNSEYFDLIASKRIWIIPECPKHYSLSYIWPTGSPWANAIDELLLKFLSSGLIQKFEREMKFEIDIKIMVEKLYEDHKYFRILSYSDLQLAFYALILGCLLSTLTFLYELLYSPKIKTTFFAKL
ncbi:uncharacterized protein ACRADG_010435 [Cochliomyia hominivorax]